MALKKDVVGFHSNILLSQDLPRHRVGWMSRAAATASPAKRSLRTVGRTRSEGGSAARRAHPGGDKRHETPRSERSERAPRSQSFARLCSASVDALKWENHERNPSSTMVPPRSVSGPATSPLGKLLESAWREVLRSKSAVLGGVSARRSANLASNSAPLQRR